ncbi:MAG: AAA family ATPase [Christensenellales bacterium]
MDFKETFRDTYRIALQAARANDTKATIMGLRALHSLLVEQYYKENGDSVLAKAKLSYWSEIFGAYIKIIETNGLKDKRVQKLFGLIVDDSVPSFADILNGGHMDARRTEPSVKGEDKPVGISPKAEIPKPDNKGGVSMDGLFDMNDSAKAKANPEDAKPIQQPVVDLPWDNKDEGAKEDDNKDDGLPKFEPERLKDFIGQKHIVQALTKEINIAKNKGLKHLDNILLFGNPGLGKTTLMKLIAKELGVKFEFLDCSQFRNSQQSLAALQRFLDRIATENEPVVIALDEIHALNDTLQTSLLTLLNDREYVTPINSNGVSRRIVMPEFTFIGATTDDNDVLPTIKNRCLRLTFQLEEYSFDELKRIYSTKFASKGLTVDDEAINLCIPRSRGAIRYVNAIVDGLDHALYTDDGHRISMHVSLDTAKKYFDKAGINEMGLTPKDIEILQVIKEYGEVGIDVLSARIGQDPKKYQSEYERYLIRIGFVNMTQGKGRSLTEKAIAYLKSKEEPKDEAKDELSVEPKDEPSVEAKTEPKDESKEQSE